MEKTYRIIDKTIRISLEEKVMVPDVFDRFSCPDGEADLLISSDREGEKQSCYGLGYLSGRGEKIQNVFFSQQDRGKMLYSITDDYSCLRLQVDGNCTKDILSELLMAGFYSYVSLQQALLLHASAVSYQDKAVIFTAPSGVGKTTQAELWKAHRHATIINGDKVFLTKDADRIIAWGSPWKGSSAYAENIGVEAAAIVVLEQAEENEIRKLSGMEVLEKLLPHVFFPNWDARCEEAVLALLDDVLARTEVYLLRCRADEDAVALVEKTVF